MAVAWAASGNGYAASLFNCGTTVSAGIAGIV